MVINKPGQSNNNNGIDTVLLLRTGESLDIKILSLKPFLSRRRILMMVYVRAERKIELALHLDVCKKMLPHFFAAGHWNYAKHAVAYVQMMENPLENVLKLVMKKEHIMRLQERLWNAT